MEDWAWQGIGEEKFAIPSFESRTDNVVVLDTVRIGSTLYIGVCFRNTVLHILQLDMSKKHFSSTSLSGRKNTLTRYCSFSFNAPLLSVSLDSSIGENNQPIAHIVTRAMRLYAISPMEYPMYSSNKVKWDDSLTYFADSFDLFPKVFPFGNGLLVKMRGEARSCPFFEISNNGQCSPLSGCNTSYNITSSLVISLDSNLQSIFPHQTKASHCLLVGTDQGKILYKFISSTDSSLQSRFTELSSIPVNEPIISLVADNHRIVAMSTFGYIRTFPFSTSSPTFDITTLYNLVGHISPKFSITSSHIFLRADSRIFSIPMDPLTHFKPHKLEPPHTEINHILLTDDVLLLCTERGRLCVYTPSKQKSVFYSKTDISTKIQCLKAYEKVVDVARKGESELDQVGKFLQQILFDGNSIVVRHQVLSNDRLFHTNYSVTLNVRSFKLSRNARFLFLFRGLVGGSGSCQSIWKSAKGKGKYSFSIEMEFIQPVELQIFLCMKAGKEGQQKCWKLADKSFTLFDFAVHSVEGMGVGIESSAQRLRNGMQDMDMDMDIDSFADPGVSACLNLSKRCWKFSSYSQSQLFTESSSVTLNGIGGLVVSGGINPINNQSIQLNQLTVHSNGEIGISLTRLSVYYRLSRLLQYDGNGNNSKGEGVQWQKLYGEELFAKIERECQTLSIKLGKVSADVQSLQASLTPPKSTTESIKKYLKQSMEGLVQSHQYLRDEITSLVPL